MLISRKSRLLKMTACSVKVGTDHAFIDSASMKVKCPASTVLYGVSLMGVKQFAMDFDLHPTLLAPSLLFKIFEEVLGSAPKLKRSSSDQQFSSPAHCTMKYRTVSVLEVQVLTRSSEHCNATYAEPLLTIDQVSQSTANTIIINITPNAMGKFPTPHT